MPAVDVVVPVLDGADVLGDCLGALCEQLDVDHRIFVVDNGSRDGSPAIAAEAGATVLHEPERSSYAARNTGVAAGSAPVVAFTDADCIPDPRWLAEGCAALGGGAAAVAGRIVQLPSDTLMGRYEIALYLAQERYVSELGFGATANLLVRRDVLESLGGFLPVGSGGDLELGLRLRDAGHELVYASDAVVAHHPRTRVVDGLRKARRLGKGHIAIGREHPELLRIMLSPRRLLPMGHELRKISHDPRLVALDLLVRSVEWTARWEAQLRSAARRKKSTNASI